MYSFTLNTKPLFLPETAKELKLKQFVAITKAGTDLQMLEALLGELPDVQFTTDREFNQYDKEIKGVFRLVELLSQSITNTIASGILLVAPAEVQIIGLPISIKSDAVETGAFWGKVHTQQVILKRVEQTGKDEKFDATDLIPNMLAHNLYTVVTKSPYNEAKADEFEEVVLEMNWIEAFQLANFFLIQHKKLWTSRRLRWRMRWNLLRLRLASKYSTNTGL